MAGSSTARTFEGLNDLYQEGDFENVVHRARKALRSGAGEDNGALRALLAAGLMQGGSFETALTEVNRALESKTLPPLLVEDMVFARAYALYSLYRLDEALAAIKELRTKNPQHTFAVHLEAQINCRRGDFTEAVNLYRSCLEAPVRRRRGWLSSGPAVEQTDKVNKAEVIANLCSSLVSNGMAEQALEVRKDHPEDWKTSDGLYNIACGMVALGDYDNADVMLKRSLEMSKEILEAEGATEADVLDDTTIIRTQLAYVRQVKGDVVGADGEYANILTKKPRDVATTAVAANNLASTRWSLESSPNLLGLQKRMKMTTGDAVEAKVPKAQRKVMASNRAIVCLQMGKGDMCRKELEVIKKLQGVDKNGVDERVRMIEATLDAREKRFDLAESKLAAGGEAGVLFAAALAQVKLDHDDKVGAADALVQLTSNPAAVATACKLYELGGDLDASKRALADVADRWLEEEKSSLAMDALAELAALHLRHEEYDQAIEALQKLLGVSPENEAALANLVIASTYADQAKALGFAKKLPPLQGATSLDPVALEALPAPGKRERLMDVSRRVKKEEDRATVPGVVKKKKKNSKARKYIKSLPPDAPKPDPERWLPKHMRSGYKARKRGDGLARGAQGASLTAVAAASDRMDAAAANAGSNVQQGPTTTSRPKGAKPKKKRTRK